MIEIHSYRNLVILVSRGKLKNVFVGPHTRKCFCYALDKNKFEDGLHQTFGYTKAFLCVFHMRNKFWIKYCSRSYFMDVKSYELMWFK